jgi:hypothetical protein
MLEPTHHAAALAASPAPRLLPLVLSLLSCLPPAPLTPRRQRPLSLRLHRPFPTLTLHAPLPPSLRRVLPLSFPSCFHRALTLFLSARVQPRIAVIVTQQQWTLLRLPFILSLRSLPHWTTFHPTRSRPSLPLMMTTIASLLPFPPLLHLPLPCPHPLSPPSQSLPVTPRWSPTARTVSLQTNFYPILLLTFLLLLSLHFLPRRHPSSSLPHPSSHPPLHPHSHSHPHLHPHPHPHPHPPSLPHLPVHSQPSSRPTRA